MTTAARLLQQIDRLSYPDRQRLLGDTARRLADSGGLPALLDDLASGDAFGRRLSLQLAVMGGDLGHVEQCLDAPEPGVRGRAIAAAVALGVAPSVLTARVEHLPAAHRTILYRALRRRPSGDLAEALLPLVRPRFGDREAAALLPALDGEQVRALLPGLDHAVGSWSALGRRHPDVVLAHVESRLDAEPEARWGATWAQLDHAVAAAVPADPGRVLALLERSLPHVPFPSGLFGRVGMLARFDATRFARLLTDPRHHGRPPLRRKVLKTLAGADEADLVLLGRLLEPAGQLPGLLHALPPALRPAVHSRVVVGRDPGPSELWGALAAVDELPGAARHAEARRLLALPSVADDPDLRLEVHARLDWSDARDTLLEATRRPDAADRARAWTVATRAAAQSRDPEVWSGFLGSLDRFRNDQDLVRCAVLSGLASAPPWLFGADDGSVVVRLVREAAEARDCSQATRAAIRMLCDRLLHEGSVKREPALVRAALDGWQVLGAHGAHLDLHGIDRDLPRGAEHDLLASLVPRIEADAARGEHDLALALAQGLGRRAWRLPQLQAYVDRARAASSDWVVQQAVALWLAPPEIRDERVAEVLRSDRSTITIPAVAHVVGWRRTDLLDDVLRRSMHGRFLKRGVRLVPAFDRCFDRWLPRQVSAHAALLTAIATSTGRPAWERAGAVRTLSRAGADLAVLRSLTGSTDVGVAEAAVAGLAHVDDPTDALPDLVALAGTDRARVAVPAITRAVRFLPPDDVPTALRPLLQGPRVTSRKEAVRLLAEHHVPGAARLLMDAWAATDQHRDVRRAVASAARSHLDDPVAWEVLDLAVDTPDVATALLDVPAASLARRHRPAYAALVHRVALSEDPDTARVGLTALAAWLPWRPEAFDDLVAAVTDLSRTAGWRPALAALVAGCASSGEADHLVRAARALAGADDDSRDSATRDRPAHQRFSSLVHATRVAAQHAGHRHLAAAVGDAVATARPDAAVRLLAAALDLPSAGDLRRICELADRPVLALRAQRTVAQAIAGQVDRLPRGHAERLLDDLLPHDGLALGLVAVAVASATGAAEGWPEGLRAQVLALRTHPDPDVRLAALDVAMAPE